MPLGRKYGCCYCLQEIFHSALAECVLSEISMFTKTRNGGAHPEDPGLRSVMLDTGFGLI